jgi:hypothetical protein
MIVCEVLGYGVLITTRLNSPARRAVLCDAGIGDVNNFCILSVGQLGYTSTEMWLFRSG